MPEFTYVDTAPANGSSESQQIAQATGTVTAGRFRLGFGTGRTGWLNWNATANQVRDALRAVNEVTASGTGNATGGALPGTPIVVPFAGQQGNRNVPQMTIAESELVGGTYAVTTSVAGVEGTRGYRKGAIVVARDTGVAYQNTGTEQAPAWKRLLATSGSVPADLTGSNGTADGAVADVGASFSQATLNDNFRELSTRVNQILALLR